MKKATVNLTNCKYLYELHQRFQEALDFPNHYGKNLDAFWDCINRECDVDFVTIVGCESVAEDLKPTLRKILDMFEENKKYWADKDYVFDYEIIS